MQTKNQEQIQALLDIGFNNLEAEIYITLLQEPELTGYRIAKILGKPVANTYKTLESLKNKGAVLLEESSNSKIYSAVPITDYLNILEEQFRLKRKHAESQLQDLGKLPGKEGIYKLQTVEQVYERCKTMFDNTEQVILADIFPTPLHNLKAELEDIAKNKGVEVHLKVYEPVDLENCNIINTFNAEELLELWNGQWVVVVSDVKEALIAVITDDGKDVRYGIWTRNPYISFIVYNGAMNELVSFTMQNLLKENKEADYIKSYIQKYRNIVDVAKVFSQEMINKPAS